MAEPDSALGVPPAYTSPTGERSDAPRRLRFLHVLPLLVFAGLALLFLVRLFAGDPSRVPSALIGRPVPAFALDPVPGLTEAGAPVPGLSDADLKGRVTVVNVWASWCVPCRQEHPALVELAKNPADPGRRHQLQGQSRQRSPLPARPRQPLRRHRRRFVGARGHRLGRLRRARDLRRRPGRHHSAQAYRAAPAGADAVLHGQGAGGRTVARCHPRRREASGMGILEPLPCACLVPSPPRL